MAEKLTDIIKLIDEVNERVESRRFYGIGQVLHGKLCTIRYSLLKASRATPDRSDDALAEENRRLFDALERAREYVERASYDAFDDREDRLLAVIDAALKGDGL